MQHQISLTPNRVIILPVFAISAGYFTLLNYSLFNLTTAAKIIVFCSCVVLAILLYRWVYKNIPKSFLITQSGKILYQQIAYTPNLIMDNFLGWFCLKLTSSSGAEHLWLLHISMLTSKDASRFRRLLR
ncbi:hypothetical protein DS2_02408 [Catenovulum agarivorans DS-2]|uniref:Uncharacterized protein n=1 Tax=Catenovulum agarivorans DS-2 TaxID=1328313 RepID=W7QGD9_9ALTE|nr:hypothetical protein DS2_02408 [Catenovulum agarivorans DS-2]